MKRIFTALCLSLLVPFLLHSSNLLQEAPHSKHKKSLTTSLTPHLNTSSAKQNITPTSKPTIQEAISTPRKLSTQPSIELINDPLLPAASTQSPLPTEALRIDASAITLSEPKTPAEPAESAPDDLKPNHITITLKAMEPNEAGTTEYFNPDSSSTAHVVIETPQTEEPSEPIVATQAKSVPVQTSLKPTLPQRTFKFTIDENNDPYIGTEYWKEKNNTQAFNNGAIKPILRFKLCDNETITEKAALLLATWCRASECDKQLYPKSFIGSSSELYNSYMNEKNFETCPEDEKNTWKAKNFSLRSLDSYHEEFTHESYTCPTLPQPPKLIFESSESIESATQEIIDLSENQLNSTERTYIEELYSILHSEQKELAPLIPEPERWTANLRNALEKIRGGDTAKIDSVSRILSWTFNDEGIATKKHKNCLNLASKKTDPLYSKYLEIMSQGEKSRKQQDSPELRDARKKLAQQLGFNLSAKTYAKRRNLTIVAQHEKAKKALA
jgi:hypothetical protein